MDFQKLTVSELVHIFSVTLLTGIFPFLDTELFVCYPVDDLKANAEYTGYTVASNVIQWFWEVASSFSKEDMARLLQFVTGTSKVHDSVSHIALPLVNRGSIIV